MITNSDLFYEINKYKKNTILSKKISSRELNKKLIIEKKKLFNKFSKTFVKTFEYKISEKIFLTVAGAYTNYFIDFFVYYHHFASEITFKNNKSNFDFKLGHNFNYFSSITQDKEFILYILEFIKFKKLILQSDQEIKIANLNLLYKNNHFKNNNINKKDIVEIFFHEKRHKKKLKQFSSKQVKIFHKKNFESLKLKTLKRDKDLRYNFIKNFNPKTTLEKKFLIFFYDFYSTLFLESILINLDTISKKIKYFPKVIMTDAHGWFMNDRFRFYLGVQSYRGSKIIDFQINGATNLADYNPHAQVASKFCDEMALWINKDLGLKKKFKCVPSLYFNKIQTNEIIKSNSTKEILYLGCGISKYFVGFWSSYISGGYIKKYLDNSFEFLSNIRKKNLKILKFRVRIGNFLVTKNSKKPMIQSIINYFRLNGLNLTLKKIFKKIINIYSINKNNSDDFYDLIDNKKEKFFKSINYDPILPGEIGIERMKRANIIIVDHPSTPVFEALSLNKPTIIFWTQDLNFIHSSFKNLVLALKKNKILFFSPKEAAFQLNRYLESENAIEKLWYQNNKIQFLIEKIQKLLLNNKIKNQNNTVIKQWEKFIKQQINS